MSDVSVKVLDHGARITIKNGAARRVTISNTTKALINNNRPKTVPVVRDTPVNVTQRDTIVRTGGGMGIQGRPGAPGSSIPAIAFAYGDAAHVVWTPTVAGTWNYARVIVDEAFDGVGAVIRIGTLADPDIGIPGSWIDAAATNETENTPDVHLAAGTGVAIAITPGAGATRGRGRLLLEFLPD